MFENPTVDIAGTVPSGTNDFGDVWYFLELKEYLQLESALITNGISTFHLRGKDFLIIPGWKY